MTRSTGAPPRGLIDRKYPHQVLIDEKKVGGNNMPRVSDHLAQMGLVLPPTFTVFDNDRWHRIFCFAEKTQAETFIATFGGEIIDPKRKSSRNWTRLSPA